jgi:uncharacterized coiled-coil protein SlyX
MRRQMSTEGRALAADAKAFLGALPWDNDTVRNMWRYLGPHWTTSSMQNDLLDELSGCITAQPDLAARLQVKNLALTAKIMEAAATQTADTYQTAQSFRWIRALGEDITHRQQVVLTLHHLGNHDKHWVSLVIDGEHQMIRYGNSYGTEMPPDLVEACQWWLSQHAATPFAVEVLPITAQSSDDTSSCGFLSDNSLGHFAFPNTVPLVASSGIKAARTSAFLLIAAKVLDQVRRGYIR